MKKNKFFYVIPAAFILIAVLLFLNNQFSATEASLYKIRKKANLVFNRITKNIRTLIIKSNIYNSEGSLIITKELFTDSFSNFRINETNFSEQERYVFTSDNGKTWFSKFFIPIDFFIFNLVPTLAEKSTLGKIIEKECGPEKLPINIRCFLVTFLFDNNYLIKGYLDYRHFTWLKIELFVLDNKNWIKKMDIYNQKWKNMKGITVPLESVIFLYTGGNKIRALQKYYSIEINKDIKNSIFEIPLNKN